MSAPGFIIVASHDSAQLAPIEQAITARQVWQKLPFEGPAIVFTTSGCRHYASSDTNLLLLGTVFRRSSMTAPKGALEDTIPFGSSLEAVKALLKAYWGAFVAVSYSHGSLQVVRDPSAGMPCYYTKLGAATLIASSASALLECGACRPSIAIDEVAHGLYRDDLPSELTAIAGMMELLPGDVLTTDSWQIQSSWSPWEYVTSDERVDFASQAALLRQTVQGVTRAWTSAFDRILIGVSGGLDSSIVAAGANPSKTLCLTVTTDDVEGDERDYARLLCAYLDLQLVECRYQLEDIDIQRAASARLPRPTGRTIAQGYNAAVSGLITQHDVAAFFTGNGGDNVFAFSRSAAAVADRYLREGLTKGTWDTLRDVSRLNGCGLLEAAQSARRCLKRQAGYLWREDRRYLSPGVLAEFDRRPLVHPWLEAPDDALPGKAAHIASLLRIQRHLDGIGQMGEAALVNPLMSLPIIETCLAIPTWMWCQNARNRSVARSAFEEILPSALIARSWKGSPSGFGTQIVTHFHDGIRERLLDGHLSRAGIIDRPVLEQRLNNDRPDWGPDQTRVLELLEVEAWIDHWRGL